MFKTNKIAVSTVGAKIKVSTILGKAFNVIVKTNDYKLSFILPKSVLKEGVKILRSVYYNSEYRLSTKEAVLTEVQELGINHKLATGDTVKLSKTYSIDMKFIMTPGANTSFIQLVCCGEENIEKMWRYDDEYCEKSPQRQFASFAIDCKAATKLIEFFDKF